MDDNFSDTLSKFYGHLSKFCKGQIPSALEAQFLLDMAMSVFGFLVNRVNEFSPDTIQKSK